MRIELTEHWIATQEDFDAFAKVSGDDNPIHVDPEFSSRTAFGRTVSHGMLIYSKLWGMIVNAAPNARQVQQKMMFPNPTFAGDLVELRVSGTVPGLLTISARRADRGDDLFLGETEVTL